MEKGLKELAILSFLEGKDGGGGDAPSGTKEINITSNGTTTHDVEDYKNAKIIANVPNSYAAGDEGKVVSDGALVAQTSDTVTENGTVDTTLISSLTVNVSGGSPSGTKQISISSNGTTTENVASYASAEITVAVPNSYSAGDEGKVVSNGALVAQTSDTVTQNGTVDTTLISSLLVNVSGGGENVETGSFVATTSDSITIPVTSMHKILQIWWEDYDPYEDLSSNPYGAYQVLNRVVLAPEVVAESGYLDGLLVYAMTRYDGKGLEVGTAIGSPTSNNISFSSSAITISTMRINGGDRKWIDGATYYWRAV